MTHTRKTYQKRVKAAGFNMASWARECDVNRSTIKRQFDGTTNPIPLKYWIALDTIDGKGFPR